MLGYDHIPEVWKSGIPRIANTRFAYTQYSFNEIVASTQARALKVVEQAGGKITPTEIEIPLQEPQPPPLEQWDAGVPTKKVEYSETDWTFKGAFTEKVQKFPWGESIKFKETKTSGSEANFTFQGTGVVIVGRCIQDGGRADVYLDGEKTGDIDAWIPNDTTDNDYWHVNGLKNERHTVRIVARSDADSRSSGTKLQIVSAIVYGPTTP